MPNAQVSRSRTRTHVSSKKRAILKGASLRSDFNKIGALDPASKAAIRIKGLKRIAKTRAESTKSGNKKFFIRYMAALKTLSKISNAEIDAVKANTDRLISIY
jgi:hypothetical protein